MSKLLKRIWPRQLSDEKKSSSGNVVRVDMIRTFAESYPHIAEMIFSLLDYETLVKCQRVSRDWRTLSVEVKFKRLERNWKGKKYFRRRVEIFRPDETVQEVRLVKRSSNEIYFFLNDNLKIFDDSSLGRNTRHRLLFDLPLPPGNLDFDVKDDIFFISSYANNELVVAVYDRISRKRNYVYKFADVDNEDNTVKIGYDGAIYVIMDINGTVAACRNGKKYLIIEFPKLSLISSLSNPIVNVKLYLTNDNESIVCFRSPRQRFCHQWSDLNVGFENSTAAPADIFIFKKPSLSKDNRIEPCKFVSLLTPFHRYLQNIVLRIDSQKATLICVSKDSSATTKKKLSIRELNLKTGEMTILSPSFQFTIQKSVAHGLRIGFRNLIIFQLFDEMFEEPPEIRILPINEEDRTLNSMPIYHIDDGTDVFKLKQTSYGYDQFYIKYFDEGCVLAQRDKIFRDPFIELYDITVP